MKEIKLVEADRLQHSIAHSIAGAINALNPIYCSRLDGEDPALSEDPSYETVIAGHVADFINRRGSGADHLVDVLKQVVDICETGVAVV